MDLVPRLSQSSFEMHEVVATGTPSPLYSSAAAPHAHQQIGQQQHIGPPRYRGGGEDTEALVERPSVAARERRYDGYFVAWELWHFLAFLWMALLTAGLVVALVFALLTYNRFNDYKKSNNKDINSLETCCTNNTGAITIIQTNITTIAGDVNDNTNDILNIFNELGALENQTAILEQCCANNTAAIQTLNTNLWALTLEVWMDEAAIDVLTENVGSLQLQIDNL